MIKKCLAVVFVAFGVVGCASIRMGDTTTDASLKKFSTKPDVAGVYVYCDEWMGVIPRTNVEIDGQPFGQNTSFTYLHTELAPGRHTVTVKAENTEALEIDAEAGTNYYIWQEVKAGWFTPRTKLHLVSESEGQKGVNAARLASPTFRTEDQTSAQVAGASAAIGPVLLILLQFVAGIAALAP